MSRLVIDMRMLSFLLGLFGKSRPAISEELEDGFVVLRDTVKSGKFAVKRKNVEQRLEELRLLQKDRGLPDEQIVGLECRFAYNEANTYVLATTIGEWKRQLSEGLALTEDGNERVYELVCPGSDRVNLFDRDTYLIQWILHTD